MPKHIDEIEFTIFDTETTGLNPASGDRIVELAALRFKGKDKISQFQTLINPKREIAPEAFAVNRITRSMLEDAPEIGAIMPGFLDFIEGSCLCSYNIEFDLAFLNNELKIIGSGSLSGRYFFDILTIARRLMPGQERYALWFIAQKLGVSNKQEHRALSDVEMTWEVFNRLKEICFRKGISDFGEFSRLFAFNPVYTREDVSAKVSQIEKAIGSRATLRIKYLSAKDASVSLREVIPREIRADARNKYLVGYCCLKQEERTFKIENILEMEMLA